MHALHPNQFGLVAAQFGLLVGRCWPAFTEFTEFLAGPYSLGFVFFSLALADSYILKVPFDKEDASGIVYVWVGNSADAEEARITEEIARDMYDAVSHAPCPSFFFLFVASQCFCFVCPFVSVWLRGRTGFFFTFSFFPFFVVPDAALVLPSFAFSVHVSDALNHAHSAASCNHAHFQEGPHLETIPVPNNKKNENAPNKKKGSPSHT